jgi:hypothetical protein
MATTLEAMKEAPRWLLYRTNTEGRKIPFYANGKPRSGTQEGPQGRHMDFRAEGMTEGGDDVDHA